MTEVTAGLFMSSGIHKIFEPRTSPLAAECRQTRPGITVVALSDVGRQRANNEDSYLYWEAESKQDFDRKGRLAIIADGMGGYEGGQEASRLAVETVRHVYDVNFGPDPQQSLIAAFLAAHETIHRYSSEHQQFQGMGTTCTALSVVDHRLYFGHVGDSRLYLVRRDCVSRLTRDHSYVGRLVESGIVRSEDAESHPQRHILTAALGSGREVMPDTPDSPLVLEPGDTVALCTDGLWSVVGEKELAAAVRSNSPSDACLSLVKLALERGGPDNITLVVLHLTA